MILFPVLQSLGQGFRGDYFEAFVQPALIHAKDVASPGSRIFRRRFAAHVFRCREGLEQLQSLLAPFDIFLLFSGVTLNEVFDQRGYVSLRSRKGGTSIGNTFNR